MDRFEGKVAIVTGGGGAIGRATALRLAAEGAQVTVADLDDGAAAKVADEITGAGGTAHVVAVDVADPAAVEAMVASTVERFGGLDVLHNNAAAIALNHEDQDVVTMDLATWHQVLAVNLTGPMLGCRYAIPAMLERGGGVIVNTASAAAFYGSTTLAAYGTSKAGLIALTRYVATAYGDRGIRCNAIAPGVVVPKATQDALGGPMSDTLRRYSESHLVGRLGYPEEIAAAVAFLASDDGAFVTGEVLRVDGGFTTHGPTHSADRSGS